MSRSVLLLACAVAAFCLACEGVKELLGVQDEGQLDVVEPPLRLEPHTPMDAGVESPDEPISRLPLERALTKFPLLAKGAPNLGFNLAGLAALHALHAEVAVPTWGAAADDDPSRVLDDDLETGWRCRPAGRRHCTIGLQLTADAEVKAVRVFAAGGTTAAARAAHLRPKRVRIHTAQGFADANLPDEKGEVYVILGKPAVTPNVSVEFLEFWNAKKDAVLVAEVEAYGPRGGRRAPLTVDPKRVIATWEGPSWTKSGASYRPALAFLREVAPDGHLHTFAMGTALRGDNRDRVMLIERLESSTCARTEGTVQLLDRDARIVAPLGELGGVGADLFRHRKGTAVVLGYTDEYSTELAGVFIDGDGDYTVRRTPAREDKRKKDTFGDWNVEPLVIPRSGTPLGGGAIGCDRPGPEDVARLASARGSKTDLDPARWTACSVGNAVVFLSDDGLCGPKWSVVLVGADGSLLRDRSGSHPGSHLRVVRFDEETLLVEATGTDDSGWVLRVGPSKIDVLTEHGALAMPPPGACRSECGDGFPNPHAPEW